MRLPFSLGRHLLLGAFLAGLTQHARAEEPEAIGSSAAAQASVPRLDQEKLHEVYLDGEFEKVVAGISLFKKKNREHSREDSIFIARHLGVVLAADPKTLEAGKYWMHRLILLDPNADLAAMYASEAIERLFEKVKEEDGVHDAVSTRPNRVWIYAGGAVLTVAAAVSAWILLWPEPAQNHRTVVNAAL